MHKIIRSLTVIGATAALAISGASAATAQTSISDISSWLTPGRPGGGGGGGGPTQSEAEQALYNAGVNYGADSTGRPAPTQNTAAKNAYKGNPFTPLTGPIWQRTSHTATHHIWVLRVLKNERQALSNFLYANQMGGQVGREYGVHASTSDTHYFVAIAFRL